MSRTLHKLHTTPRCVEHTSATPQSCECGLSNSSAGSLVRRRNTAASPCPALTNDGNAGWPAVSVVGTYANGLCSAGWYGAPTRLCDVTGWGAIQSPCQRTLSAADRRGHPHTHSTHGRWKDSLDSRPLGDGISSGGPLENPQALCATPPHRPTPCTRRPLAQRWPRSRVLRDTALPRALPRPPTAARRACFRHRSLRAFVRWGCDSIADAERRCLPTHKPLSGHARARYGQS